MKTCKRCGLERDLDLFNRDSSRRDGRHPYCRDCKLADSRARYVPKRSAPLSPDERAERKREARRRYRERQGEEAMREYNRAYVDANRARHNERNRQYRMLRGRGYGTEATRLRRARRIEHYRAVHRVGVALRRARQRGVLTIPFTDAQLSDRLSFFGFRCWMCGGDWEHVDHVKPISKGGPHILANLRPACASCNTSKRGAWPVSTEFRLRRTLS